MGADYDAGLICVYEHNEDLQVITNRAVIVSCVVSCLSLAARCFDEQSLAFPGRLATQTTLVAVLFSFNLLVSVQLDFRQMDMSDDVSAGHRDTCRAQGIAFQFLAVAFLVYWAFIGAVTWMVK